MKNWGPGHKFLSGAPSHNMLKPKDIHICAYSHTFVVYTYSITVSCMLYAYATYVPCPQSYPLYMYLAQEKLKKNFF